MIEFYTACIAALLIGLLLGVASHFWNKPDKRSPIQIGSMVHVDGQGRAVFKVTGECECPGHGGPRALFVQRVTPVLEDFGLLSSGWFHDLQLRPAIVIFAAPDEVEARILNDRFGIVCDGHPKDDCSHKGRQREALGLPGHQR